ncbi:hypothetical protein SEA_BABYGOTBAC_33 [Streptomyces phage BabyGotBac]|nr:hypothetical protein SEA_BABYGOTBAC_33 [Streptomyces phage BabyGotBac]
MDLQCPYCPETRPSRSRLVTHVDSMHGNVSVARRTLDLRNPRTVETVAVTSPALTIESSETAHVVQCVCGAPIEPADDSTEYPDWTHVFPMPKCRDAIPAAGMPTKADRESLDAALARTGAGLAEAGREMAEMRAALDAVDERMRKLDAQLTSPATVRRATLNQVWDKLLDAGDLTGAAIVMKMINRVVDDA